MVSNWGPYFPTWQRTIIIFSSYQDIVLIPYFTKNIKPHMSRWFNYKWLQLWHQHISCPNAFFFLNFRCDWYFMLSQLLYLFEFRIRSFGILVPVYVVQELMEMIISCYWHIHATSQESPIERSPPLPQSRHKTTRESHSRLHTHRLIALVGEGGGGEGEVCILRTPGVAASPISLLSMGGVSGRSLTVEKILFTGRQTCSLYLVLWLCAPPPLP